MNEHMSPIPSRLYNAAVGGHVAGADQIIDDNTGLTLDKVTGGALEEKEYTSGSNNGMGRVVLRKNLVEGVNTLTQSMINKSNTIYVIQYDFTLGENITIPANCVLEFDGGGVSGSATITGNNTGINSKIYNIFGSDISLSGSWNVDIFYMSWFASTNASVVVNNIVSLVTPRCKTVLFDKNSTYRFNETIVLDSEGKGNVTLDFDNSRVEDSVVGGSDPASPYDLYNPLIAVLNTSNVIIKNLNYNAINKVNSSYGVEEVYITPIKIGGNDPTENIKIENVKFESCNNDNSKFIGISINGNSTNIKVDNIVFLFDVTAGINNEWGYDSTTQEVFIPKNIEVSDVYGENLQSCTIGLLRCSCASNVLFKNCHAKNVRKFIDVNMGDKGSPDGRDNNLLFENCWAEVSSDATGYYAGVNIDTNGKKTNETLYPLNILFNNCSFKNYSQSIYTQGVRIYSSQAPITFVNCHISGFANNVYLADNTLSEGVDNNIVFYHCFIEGSSTFDIGNCIFDGCLFKTDAADEYLIKIIENSLVIFDKCTFIAPNITMAYIYVKDEGISKVIVLNSTFKLNKPAFRTFSSYVYAANNLFNGAKFASDSGITVFHDFD